MDENKALNIAADIIKEKDKKNAEAKAHEIETYSKKLGVLDSQIKANEALSYEGKEELLGELERKYNNYASKIANLNKYVNVDYIKEFQRYSKIYDVYFGAIELDKREDFCLDDYLG